MNARGRSYRYVGPVELKAAVRPGDGGRRIGSAADFGGWIVEQSAAELTEPFTFVIDWRVCFGWPHGEVSTWPVPAETWF